MARERLAKLRERRLTLTSDPRDWLREALGVELWPRQWEFIELALANKRVAIRAGHKISKSHSAVCLALYWVMTKPRGRVIMTATTNPQIRNVLWKELKRIAFHARIPLPRVPEMPGLGMQWPDGREIIGLSTRESERMAGLSGPQMLFIVDEASGVPEKIFDAIEGNRAAGAHVLMLGNPTQPTGTFFNAFHGRTSSFWKTLHISSIEATEYAEKFPGIATKEWCDEKLSEWGESDPRYQVRVLGNFADASELSVVPLWVVEAAKARWEDDECGVGRLELGVDVARFGDDESVIIVRRGRRVLELVARTQLDEPSVASLVVEVSARHHVTGEQKPLVKVDACGVGLGVLSVLRTSYAEHVDVYGVNGADPANSDDFYNMRSQLWFAAAEWLRDGGAIPPDDRLEGDLLSAHFSFDTAHNRRKVERKEEIKRRINRSPDRADALALAVYAPRARLVHLPRALTAVRTAATGYRLGANRGY